MMLWGVGARQARAANAADRDHRALYDRGLLVRIDVEGGEVREVLHDDERTGFGAAFKGVSGNADRLMISQEGGVLDVHAGQVVARWTDPRLNDVHHAIDHAGVRIVVSTGTDGVLVGDRFVPLAPAATPPRTDVRRRSLTPATVHPNHAFTVEGTCFVTRGRAGDAVSLDGAHRWPLADTVVHDGVVCADGVWFTAVDGQLIRVDAATGVVDRRIQLRERGQTGPLGWCRGLAFGGGLAWVGFSRLRATRVRRNLAWVRGWLRGRIDVSRRPTRIVGFDPASGWARHTVELGSHGMDAIFGLLRG